MKVGIDGREFVRDRVTGLGRYLHDSLSALAAAKKDWEFLLILNQHSDFSAEFPNLKTRRFWETFTTYADQVQLPRILAEEKCDFFFSPYNKTPLFSGVPALVTVCDLTNLRYPAYARTAAPCRSLLKLYASKAAGVLTLSLNSKRDISQLLGTPGEKVHIVAPSVDTAVFAPDPGRARAARGRYGLEKPYLLYVGNALPHKNLDGLLAAYLSLPEELLGRYELVLAGAAGYRPRTSRAPGVCRVLPFIPESDLPGLYGGAEVFVFPSFYEGFGLPPLEAMACGCPVASSNSSCLPEVLGSAPVYFDPADAAGMAAAVRELLADAPLRLRVREAGLAQAKKYSPELLAAGMAGLFGELAVLAAGVRSGKAG